VFQKEVNILVSLQNKVEPLNNCSSVHLCELTAQ